MLVLNSEVVLRQPEHVYIVTADGRREPGVTEILKHFGYFYFPPGIEYQMARGTEVHRCIYLLEQGKLDPFSLDPVIEPYVRSYERLKARLKFRVPHAETVVWNEPRRYAGCLDAIWEIKGEEIPVDYKTGESPLPWWELQIAAYTECLPPAKKPRRRASVQLRPDGSEARVIWYDASPLAGALFNGLAANYHWKLDKGLVKKAA